MDGRCRACHGRLLFGVSGEWHPSPAMAWLRCTCPRALSAVPPTAFQAQCLKPGVAPGAHPAETCYGVPSVAQLARDIAVARRSLRVERSARRTPDGAKSRRRTLRTAERCAVPRACAGDAALPSRGRGTGAGKGPSNPDMDDQRPSCHETTAVEACPEWHPACSRHRLSLRQYLLQSPSAVPPMGFQAQSLKPGGAKSGAEDAAGRSA